MSAPKKQKTIVEKYQTLWEGGKSVTAQYPKIGYLITLYCVTKMNEDVSKNPNLPKEERDQVIAKVKELVEYKASLPKEYLDCTLEEYQSFLKTFFDATDYEDRKKTVTLKTANKFKMMSSFIDVLSKFGPIDEEMKKKKKYCTWKAVDIIAEKTQLFHDSGCMLIRHRRKSGNTVITVPARIHSGSEIRQLRTVEKLRIILFNRFPQLLIGFIIRGIVFLGLRHDIIGGIGKAYLDHNKINDQRIEGFSGITGRMQQTENRHIKNGKNKRKVNRLIFRIL